MSMLTNVERKSRSGRMFLAGVFVAILAGSVTMIYPFILMLSGSLRSDMDISQMDLLPDYLVDEDVLVRKFMEAKYNYDPMAMNLYRGSREYSFDLAAVPDRPPDALVDDFSRFANADNIPRHWQVLGALQTYKHMESRVLEHFRNRVRERYNGDIEALNRDIGAVFANWYQVDMRMPEWANPRYDYTPSPLYAIYETMVRERPVAERAMVNLTGEFLAEVIYPAYGMIGADAYNEAHARKIESYADLALRRRLPGDDEPALQREWMQFVQQSLHVSFIRADTTDEAYRAFARTYFNDSMARLRQTWTIDTPSAFEDITLPGDREWIFAGEASVYRAFLETLVPSALYLVGPEFAWRDWLRERDASLPELRAAHAAGYADWAAILLPTAAVEAHYVEANATALRWRFATRNYRIVIQQMFIQGRPFFNTIVYVALTLLLSLTVQPLAAYALSRFNPPGMWKFIFIFMATMAFPPMVSTIPQFLIIKNLNLLNTFVALVMPVCVNGYLIFLLKGFFDSIPKHLYEAATIDGASELTMFWHISMALSKPILAVVALNAFRLAWMSFMHPLIVCPDEKMHVLAVWLHQFQQSAPTSAVFASILVASIPTLLIFIFTQGTIMKGIAVPAEK
jgi:ABC-type glycerol-3-phosphate transport system permease component